MDRLHQYYKDKQHRCALAAAQESPTETEAKSRARTAEMEFAEVVALCKLHHSIHSARPNMLRLGVLLMRAHVHLGASATSIDAVCSALAHKTSDLARDTTEAIYAKHKHDGDVQEWRDAMNARLKYHEQEFAAEVAKLARIVALQANVFYRYFSSSSENGLRPWPEIHERLCAHDGKPKPKNVACVLDRFRELEDMRSLCRGL